MFLLMPVNRKENFFEDHSTLLPGGPKSDQSDAVYL
jgi:hypothetical protein